jgi:hypothetical protein
VCVCVCVCVCVRGCARGCACARARGFMVRGKQEPEVLFVHM